MEDHSHAAASPGNVPGSPKKDLTGKRFGKLSVLQKTDKRKNGSVLWLCRCACGSLCEKPTNELNSGFAVSCGCSRRSHVQPGAQFGRLTAVEPTQERRANSVVWKCLCACGSTVFVRATLLASGHTTSCGCAKRDLDEGRNFHDRLTFTDGTCLEFARDIGKSRISDSPDTGVRGVVLHRGKYEAHITFRGKRQYLGRYSLLADAVSARKAAETRIAEYLEQYLPEKEEDDHNAGHEM